MKLFFGGYDDAIEKVFYTVSENKKVTVFTPNAEMLDAARKDKSLADLLKSASLPFPDGIGVYVGARMLGYKPKERTNGIDLAERILKEAAKRKMGVFLGLLQNPGHLRFGYHRVDLSVYFYRGQSERHRLLRLLCQQQDQSRRRSPLGRFL